MGKPVQRDRFMLARPELSRVGAGMWPCGGPGGGTPDAAGSATGILSTNFAGLAVTGRESWRHPPTAWHRPAGASMRAAMLAVA